MNERIKILNMLENGDITAEEASKLLSALETQSQQTTRFNEFNNNNSNNSNSSSTHNRSSIDFSKIANKIGKVTEKVAKTTVKIYGEVEKEVKGFVKNIQSNNNKTNYSKEINFSLVDYENDLQLKALNGEMVLKGYNGDKLTIKTVYIPKNPDAVLDFYTPSNKNYIFLFKEEDFEKVSIEALVPRKYFRNLSLEVLNCNYSIDNIDFEAIETKSTNSNCIFENCSGKKASLDNLNGKIIVRNINFENLKVSNMNDYVNLNNIDVQNVDVDVLNGEINLAVNSLNDYDNYTWKIETQNHGISVDTNLSNVEYDLKARTSLGQINILKHNLKFIEKTESLVVAKTEDNAAYFKKLNLDLQTTNSTIIIK